MAPRILVAGIGNLFLGDDGFGVEVAHRLAKCPLPEHTRVVDFGIRSMDLAYALMDEYDAVVFVDAAPRGGPPGTLYLIEVSADEPATASIETHAMAPDRVLALARSMGAKLPRTYLIACEPETVLDGAETEEIVAELSPSVLASVDEAVAMVRELVARVACDERNDG